MGLWQRSLENLVTYQQPLGAILETAYRGRTVLVTGHNGFVGSWLSLVLEHSGAQVVGLALPAEQGGLAECVGLSARVSSLEGDINELSFVDEAVAKYEPDIVFHLAAQALVLPSYTDPLATISTNVIGTAHVLDAIRRHPSAKACIIITSDKCYATAESAHVESDKLGGEDPYSASKAAAEIIAHSYRSSFFSLSGPGIATARAGNIVGGGDWADSRVVPDCIRAIREGQPVLLRHPEAVRPWQHVLDAIAGYLRLGDALVRDRASYAQAWNFGPPPEAARTVGEFVDALLSSWNGHGGIAKAPAYLSTAELPERTFLTLDSSKARELLDWHQLLNFDETIDWTTSWYLPFIQSDNFDGFTTTVTQIERYLELDRSDRLEPPRTRS
jgi:CDP-glucose 4,6-dehydratase